MGGRGYEGREWPSRGYPADQNWMNCWCMSGGRISPRGEKRGERGGGARLKRRSLDTSVERTKSTM